MARPTKKAIARAVLDRHGRTFAKELGIDVAKQTPSGLFQLLVFAMLSSTRISADLAMRAAKALNKARWTTPKKMAEATWRQRVTVLNRSGYARYDESTSRMLQATCDLLLEEYGGDLRKLREAADRDPEQQRKLIKQFKGIGDAGADIFFREVQLAWDELYPFADKRMLKAAGRLDLGDSAGRLKRRVDSREDFVRLAAGLVRVDLDNDYEGVREAAT